MKKILFILTFLSITSIGIGQSVFRTINSGGLKKSSDTQTSQISLSNAWFGSSFSYQVSGDNNFEESFIFDANIIYNLELPNSDWNIPISTNFQLPTLGGDYAELELGLYPWKVISNPQSSTIIVAHGGVAYFVNPNESTDTSPQSLRILAGAEVTLPVMKSNLPITLSVTPLYEFRNLNIDNNFGIESTFIFPISPSLGVIGEYYQPIASNINSTFNLGIIINGAIGN